MSLRTVAQATPYYMLKDGNGCIGPACAPSQSGTQFSAVYGFSNKTAYEHFLGMCRQPLMPYPLVKVYLRNHVGTSNGCVNLMVLDAAGPAELSLQATTMEAVLTAHVNRTNEVATTHHLTFDQDAGAYRVEQNSV